MQLSSLSPDLTGNCCTFDYAPADRWIHATWHGFVTEAQAVHGAHEYLRQLARLPTSCLLNDNLNLWGPWFDSADWLQQVWLPYARRLGLRYVAHLVRAGAPLDTLECAPPSQLPAGLELQIFYDLADAKEWLRSCQHLPLFALA